MKIGLISDTHIPVATDRLWPEIYRAFEGVDLIRHGDAVPDVIDWLEEIAPVMAVREQRLQWLGALDLAPRSCRCFLNRRC